MRFGIKTAFYVEGDFSGLDRITAKLQNAAGTITKHSDFIQLVVGIAALTAYRPQTEGPGYSLPFPKIEVPEAYEESPGVGIRRNGDFDAPGGENDLIEVDIAPTFSADNIKWVLRRSSAIIDVYKFSNATASIFDGDDLETEITERIEAGLSEVWVEWEDVNWLFGETLTLELRDGRYPLSDALAADALVFQPFYSIVIAFGGRNNQPLNPADGAFLIAQALYSGDTRLHAGYDVHAYDEDNVDDAFAEVWSAIHHRNVQQVVILGYSQGGGATYVLSEQLSANAVTSAVPLVLVV